MNLRVRKVTGASDMMNDEFVVVAGVARVCGRNSRWWDLLKMCCALQSWLGTSQGEAPKISRLPASLLKFADSTFFFSSS
jgi:hypothetical protein